MRVEINGIRHHKCDYCRKDFTEEQSEHITLNIGQRSGKGLPPGSRINGFENNWQFERIIEPGFYDFCIPQGKLTDCINNFFWNIMTSNIPPPNYIRMNRSW